MSKSPTFNLSVHIRYHYQIFFVESHAFLAFQPFYFILDSTIMGFFNLRYNADTVGSLKSPSKSSRPR